MIGNVVAKSKKNKEPSDRQHMLTQFIRKQQYLTQTISSRLQSTICRLFPVFIIKKLEYP